MKTEAKSGITDTYVSQQRTAERNSSFKMSIVYKKCGGAFVGRNGAEKVKQNFGKCPSFPVLMWRLRKWWNGKREEDISFRSLSYNIHSLCYGTEKTSVEPLESRFASLTI
jgi:hypothetical protein